MTYDSQLYCLLSYIHNVFCEMIWNSLHVYCFLFYDSWLYAWSHIGSTAFGLNGGRSRPVARGARAKGASCQLWKNNATTKQKAEQSVSNQKKDGLKLSLPYGPTEWQSIMDDKAKSWITASLIKFCWFYWKLQGQGFYWINKITVMLRNS